MGNAIVSQGINSISRNNSTGIVTFKFKGSFNDVNIVQTFRLSFTNNSGENKTHDFSFKKVKSLFFTNNTTCGIITPNIGSTLNAPICQVANYTISFQRMKWYTHNETPTFCFGEISDYEYKLPAGWKIGSATSTGNNWIQGTESTVVTSTLSTGHSEFIQIRPKNTCGSNMQNVQPSKFILIQRPKPNIALSPSPASINCNATTPVTYTVSGTGSVTGITGYTWNLGSTNNGWIYNGSPAPQTINTATNTITLVPIAAGTAPNNVSVDVIISGNCPVSLTSNLQFIIPGGTYNILGSNLLCKNIINSFILQQTPPSGTTVTWAISPNDGSVVITPNGNSVDIDASNANPAYYYNLTASINGYCYAASAFRQFNIPSATWSGTVSGYYGWSNIVYNGQLVEGDNNLYLYGTSAYEVWNEGANAYPGTSYWEYIGGDRASWGGAYTGYLGYDFSQLNGVDSYYNFNYTDDCGSHTIPYHFIGVYAYPPSQYRVANPPTEKYKLSVTPNPANSIASVMVIETDSKAISKTFDYTTLKIIYVYDRMGTLIIQRKQIVPKTGIRLDVSMLRTNDIYNIIIEESNGLRLSGKLIKK